MPASSRLLHRALTALLVGTALPLWAAAPLLWFEDGRPAATAQEAVAILATAADEGLDPRDYGTAALSRALDSARQGPSPSPDAQSQLDDALTTALLRYLSDRQNGRIDPRQIHARFGVSHATPAPTADVLRTAVAEHRLSDAVNRTAPQLPMYDALRRALRDYRQLTAHPAWQSPLPPLPSRRLEQGQAYVGLAQLAQRLQAVGDLSPEAPLPPLFQEPLLSAVRRFQERHGLTVDGVLGRATLKQLRVTPASRVRQIELALERLRWTPYLRAPRMIVVNVPEFMLRAYEVRDGRVDVKLAMKVVVGKTLDTRTPLFTEAMRFIEFSPYWNVPPSIAQKELIPKLRRKPAYFEQQGFEFVSAGGQVVTTLAPEHLEAVLAGSWRIRQRPGSLNPLGGIKFVFPNNDQIYLHDTPEPELFARERRDFSHGCIRVEAPLALARFVLQDQPDWTEERIQAATGKDEPTTLRLKTPLPVLIAYSTVIVKGGRVSFYPDLYEQDQVLDRALRRYSAAHRRQAYAVPGAK